jgi:LacI family transcriptional regulator
LEAVSLKDGRVFMAMTIKQIAKLAGVSRTTVSRVINNHPGVRPQTRERVLKIVQEYGYEPNLVARSLAFQRLRKVS